MGTGTCPSTLPSEVDAHVPVRVESNAIPEISINQRFPKTNPTRPPLEALAPSVFPAHDADRKPAGETRPTRSGTCASTY